MKLQGGVEGTMSRREGLWAYGKIFSTERGAKVYATLEFRGSSLNLRHSKERKRIWDTG